MFNLLKMDLRRLVRSRSFYIVLGVTAAFLVLMVTMVSAVTDPEKLDALENTGMVVTDRSSDEMLEELQGMTQFDFIYECLSSGFLLISVCIGVVLFVSSDFSTGFIKNICFARPRRWEYVLSNILVAGIYSAIITILGILLALACPALAGLHLASSPIARILQYAFWLWLPHWAFALMGLALVLLTRSSTLGIILAILSGGGMVAALLQNLCQRFGWHNFAQYLLSAVVGDQCVPMLGTNQMIMILACAIGWSLVYTAGSLIAMEKRDI